MGMNETPIAERVHIGFFGRRNAGKSSVVNAVTNQELSIVSEVMGTTTDPVTKSMELLPIGPVLIIDTPGFDDEGSLGNMRVERTKRILNKTDIAVLVVDATVGITEIDQELIRIFEQKNIKYITVYNKSDLLSISDIKRLSADTRGILVSARDKKNTEQLKEKIALLTDIKETKLLAADLVNKDDTVILVTPIDGAAPKGRLILPQQMVIRELVENDVLTMVVKENEIKNALDNLKNPPKLVITDSQAFGLVANAISDDVSLTSFSILMARYKGFLDAAVKGAKTLSSLEDGDMILISEGCTHHRQCEDIGTVKLPAMIKKFTGKNLQFRFTSGGDFPDDLTEYKLVIHCGGCMLPSREVIYRMKCAEDQGVLFTNYGTAIAYINGILERSIKPLGY